MSETRRVHVGVGGWTFEPWRDNFYPRGLAHAKELQYASRQLTAVEVNGTFYSTFKPPTFAKWRDETPDGFVFALKANRFAVNRRELAGAGESISRFLASGIDELRHKLGPILWQLAPTKQFNPVDLEAFFRLLPKEAKGLPLRHVLEPRHPSFDCEAYYDLARRHGVSTVHADSDKYPALADPQMPLVYLRLMRSQPDCATGYPPGEIAKWAQGTQAWLGRDARHEVFAFFISGAKERNPAAAMELLRALGHSS